jgi:hypothetical protein
VCNGLFKSFGDMLAFGCIKLRWLV